MLRQPEYLPMTRGEMDALGWDELDILLISGDAYIDSPAAGVALLGRWLVANGFRTGIVAQPAWENAAGIARLGRPRLFAGISAGALDSLVAHYTAFRKKRHDDAYTPGGGEGARPNRATLVYAGLARQAFPGLPIAIGGVESSMRRASHYDFWSDSLRRSILLDSKADVLLYGMAETVILELARLLDSDPDARQAPAAAIARAAMAGSVYAVHPDRVVDAAVLPSHEAILADPALLVKTALAFERQMLNQTPRLLQRSGGRGVAFEPPAAPLDRAALDALYALPFTRRAHPSYLEPVPAAEMLAASVTSHRGCAGGCSFCSIALHQGRRIQSRSGESILDEIARMAGEPEWKGSVSDIGGPSANMWQARCAGEPAKCERPSCLFPKRCRNFKIPHEEQIALLRRARGLPGVKHVRVGSGVRHDLALESEVYLKAMAEEFTGGQLKIAPEHVAEKVLRLMRKPGRKSLEQFLKSFAVHSAAAGKEQYVIPYLMSAFPGCGDDDMRELAAWLDRKGFRPRQVQCFMPTPGTVASAMFFAKTDAEGNPIFVARSDGERLFQHRLLLPDAEPEPHRGGQDGRGERRKPVERGDRDKRPGRERFDGQDKRKKSFGRSGRGKPLERGGSRPDGKRPERPGARKPGFPGQKRGGNRPRGDRPQRPGFDGGKR